jgi:hypothetical protein
MLEIRILEVFNQSGLSRLEFSQKLNISNAVLSHLSSGRNKASMDLVISILQQFPEINPEWLVLGYGEMKRDNNDLVIQQLKNKLITEINKIKKGVGKLTEDLESIEDSLNQLK